MDEEHKKVNVRLYPTGGMPLSEDRLRLVAPLWEATRNSIRLMDSLELGETEPATVYIWWGCQP